jgi:ribosomal protein S27E
VQALQVISCETWRADHPALVDCLGDGQVLVLSSGGDQHTACEATGLCDDVVRMMDLAHKRETLTCDHAFLHLKGQTTAKFVGVSCKEGTHRKTQMLFTFAQERA